MNSTKYFGLKVIKSSLLAGLIVNFACVVEAQSIGPSRGKAKNSAASFQASIPALIKEAQASAETITDYALRTDAYCLISNSKAKCEGLAAAEQLLSRATNIAQKISDSHVRIGALINVSVTQRQIGDRSDSRRTLSLAVGCTEQISNVNERVKNLYDVETAQLKAGLSSDSALTARQISDWMAKAVDAPETEKNLGAQQKALIQLGETQAYCGDYQGAQKTAKKLGDYEYGNAMVMSDIAVAYADRGNIVDAETSADRIDSIFSDAIDKAYYHILRGQLKSGDISSAESTLEKLNSSKYSSKRDIMVSKGESGDLDGVLTLMLNPATNNYYLPNYDNFGRMSCAVAEAKAHHFGEAIQFLQKLRGSGLESEATAKVIGLRAKAGDFQPAIGTARHMANAYWKVVALTQIVDAIADQGVPSRARGAA